MCCSSISLFEVEAGQKPGEERLIEEFMGGLEVYNVTPRIAVVAGSYARQFRQKGVTLDVPDLIVAATAAVHELELVTANRRHYPMEGLKIYGMEER
jgi:predicted nucleic acid-binding protein